MQKMPVEDRKLIGMVNDIFYYVITDWVKGLHGKIFDPG